MFFWDGKYSQYENESSPIFRSSEQPFLSLVILQHFRATVKVSMNLTLKKAQSLLNIYLYFLLPVTQNDPFMVNFFKIIAQKKSNWFEITQAETRTLHNDDKAEKKQFKTGQKSGDLLHLYVKRIRVCHTSSNWFINNGGLFCNFNDTHLISIDFVFFR